MRLTDVLSKKHVVLPLEAESVDEALHEVEARFYASGVVGSPDTSERERHLAPSHDWIRAGHTALVAQYRSDGVRELAIGLGIAPRDLTSVGDGPGVRVVALVIGPSGAVDTHLRTVALVARLLRTDVISDALVAARSVDDVWAIDGFVSQSLPPRLTVRDIMTQRVFRVYADTPLSELLSLMSRHRLRAVPVVADKREVMGIVSDREVLRFLMPRVTRVAAEGGSGESEGGAQFDDVKVRDLMSRSVMCISEDQSISEVASLMVNKDVERFPVVREGRLTGFLTRGDIVRKMFGQL